MILSLFMCTQDFPKHRYRKATKITINGKLENGNKYSIMCIFIPVFVDYFHNWNPCYYFLMFNYPFSLLSCVSKFLSCLTTKVKTIWAQWWENLPSGVFTVWARSVSSAGIWTCIKIFWIDSRDFQNSKREWAWPDQCHYAQLRHVHFACDYRQIFPWQDQR